MRKTVNFALLLWFWAASAGLAQEFEATLSVTGRHNIYPVGEHGVVLLDRGLKQLPDGRLAILFTGYDTLLTKKWTNAFPFSNGKALVYHEVNDDGIFLFFADRSRKNYELVTADLEFGYYEQAQFSFSEPFEISEITSFYDNVWAAGAIGDNPILFRLDKTGDKYLTLPIGIPGKLKYVGGLSYHKDSNALDYVMLGEVEKEDVLIWRSVTDEGKVLRNEKLDQFDRLTVRGVRSVRLNDDRLFVTGPYGQGTREKIDGLYMGVLGGNAQLKIKTFKELSAITSYKRWKDIQKDGLNAAKTSRFNKSSRTVFVDELELNENGEVVMGLEVYTTDFKARGALEKQFIARDRVAQLDLNTYGRRELANMGGNEGETVGQRMDRGSATDQLQYRFMNQSLSKAVSNGIVYNHSGYLKISSRLKLLEQDGISFGMKDVGRLGNQRNFSNNTFVYFQDGERRAFKAAEKTIATQKITADESTQLVPWFEGNVLGVNYPGGLDKGFVLYRFAVD